MKYLFLLILPLVLIPPLHAEDPNIKKIKAEIDIAEIKLEYIAKLKAKDKVIDAFKKELGERGTAVEDTQKKIDTLMEEMNRMAEENKRLLADNSALRENNDMMARELRTLILSIAGYFNDLNLYIYGIASGFGNAPEALISDAADKNASDNTVMANTNNNAVDNDENGR